MIPRLRTLLFRASLTVAISAGLITAGLAVTKVRQKIIGLQNNLAAQTTAREKAETELSKTRTELAGTAASLKQTRLSFEGALEEKQKLAAALSAETGRSQKLTVELAQTQRVRDEARDEVARFRVAGMEPGQIVRAAKRIRELETQVAALQKQCDDFKERWQKLARSQPGHVLLPQGLQAKVVATDPRWRFLVLDAGEKEGMLENGEVLVSRQGKLVAKAKVIRVEDNRCIANLTPGWEIGQVMEGDLVVAAPPNT